jgi:hypothetical protein
VLGFDNAHGMKMSKKFQGRRVEWDHRHMQEQIMPYEFVSAGKLLEDFWDSVNRVIEGARGK